FREDLYHRINEFEILVPALREREKDLHLFTDFFIQKANDELGREVKYMDDEVLAVFENYDWPGNLRELKSVVKRMVLLTQGDTVRIGALPEDMVFSLKNSAAGPEVAGDDLKSQSEAHERQLILDVLQKV